MSSGQRRVRADWRVLSGLEEEVQQTLLLGETAAGRSGPGESPSGN